ncbi:hypothetical protein GQ457_14G015710 [Hibiscus cannabinus]
MLLLLLSRGFDNLLELDDKGDVSARDNGSGLGRFSRLIQISAERLAELLAYEGINHTRIFSNIPKGSAYQREGRNKVKVKDLKPKRIKDYLECKISQRNLNQPRKSAQAGPVVSSRDIPFVIQLKKIIEAPR